MSSHGKSKIEKHFCKDITETIMKHDTPLLGLDGADTGQVITRGTLVSVLGGDYDPKVTIIYNGVHHKVRFAAVDKPIHVGKTITFPLKPDRLGVCGTFTYCEYLTRLMYGINQHPEIPRDVKTYLKTLVAYTAGLVGEPQLAEAFGRINGDQPLKNTVDSDFMEALGPIFVAKKFPEYRRASIFIPHDGNEPLYDFAMELDGKRHLFSCKNAAGNVNTLKAPAVLARVTSNLPLCRKHKREMYLLMLITTTRVKEAPNKINEWLSKTFPSYEKKPLSTDLESAVMLERSVVSFINSSELNFIPLVKAALPDVSYVRARTDSAGFPVVKEITSGSEITRAVFRSKSSRGHMTDKLGFDL